ncbi:4-aminobutyrate aminotransferase [Robbsia andropogonis]|uniref:4-aminobutyrate aminotransferase n=1 Tax=Robbsia andropogonis TaxID=28092 RepID=A0A0F5JW33_9BURK|nr:aspartate aminotransferase family protein [Robbsia andropogonis]KKB62031.1 4-aminobutyrate aminotransferase [Robbsia andropogonis]MCP1119424.1 aspartate aminotransferase family protein [Robbsia andropogonis]MCP1129407.1 aspartate aminotransferase family protein [Robbsia andropogonis]
MPKILMVNAFDPKKAVGLDASRQRLLERRSRVLGPSYKLFYEEPLHLVRAQGVHMYDADDTAYLDVYNNVPSVGHCHPHVVEAISKQAAILNTHTRYLHELILTYAEKLIATFPSALSNVMFTCTGSETSDLALRVARNATGGTGIIVTQTAYHGITSAVSEISPSLGDNVPMGLHVRTVPAPDALRIDSAGDEDLATAFARHVESAIEDLRRHGVKVAALIVDTIFSSDGVYSDPAGFLAPAVEIIRKAGGVFIADEVQPGFARTGDAMWGFQRHGIVPELVILGKPMGNGLPIAGLVAKPEVLQDFALKARYFNTFGGNPVSCAAGLAVLEVIEAERLQENARLVGQYIRDGLHAMAGRFEQIGEVRGAGLFIGMDLVKNRETLDADPGLAIRVVNALRKRHILIGASGPEGHVLKIRPPLPFSLGNADQFLNATEDALQEVLAQ